ncbi:hypothetical protein [Mycobacterium sp. KBS0706]|uniref:hypothetical protein n=1 Tax=Mycobacterium sp. KBS0706 TaxID=2578109 RepID=UPI001C8F324D|nr:hypothetical protein [Mycobacterium sp. KBS0706]
MIAVFDNLLPDSGMIRRRIAERVHAQGPVWMAAMIRCDRPPNILMKEQGPSDRPARRLSLLIVGC